MALYDDILDGLRNAKDTSPGSTTFEAKVQEGPHEVEVIAEDFDRLGIKLRRLRLRSTSDKPATTPLNERLRSQGERLAKRETGPFKHLNITEIDGRLGGGRLRTAPEAMERGYFFEAELRGGDEIEIRRLKRRPDGQREDAPFITSEETFPEMVDTLRDGLGDSEEH